MYSELRPFSFEVGGLQGDKIGLSLVFIAYSAHFGLFQTVSLTLESLRLRYAISNSDQVSNSGVQLQF